MSKVEKIGFIGLGVMGEPMCVNLVRKSGFTVQVYDRSADAVARVADKGGIAVASPEALGAGADIVFLSLPSIAQVESVCDELLRASPLPRRVVDMSTSDVKRTRALAQKLAAAGIEFVDAPVARTKQAAVDGEAGQVTGRGR